MLFRSSFLNAAEFSQLSQRYNVKAISDGVEGFVMRFYALVLGRVDSGGLEYWSNQINKKYQTPQEVAIKFFSGQEYQDMNQNNPTFINTAYQAFFGRIADDAGKKHWGNIMESGTNRLEIIEQFIDSEEFQSLITSFGL